MFKESKEVKDLYSLYEGIYSTEFNIQNSLIELQESVGFDQLLEEDHIELTQLIESSEFMSLTEEEKRNFLQRIQDKLANSTRAGFIGQLERTRRKVFGTDKERNQANNFDNEHKVDYQHGGAIVKRDEPLNKHGEKQDPIDLSKEIESDHHYATSNADFNDATDGTRKARLEKERLEKEKAEKEKTNSNAGTEAGKIAGEVIAQKKADAKKISPANYNTNQRQTREILKTQSGKNFPSLEKGDLNQWNRTKRYTADDGKTQVNRSSVFTKHFATGKPLGVMTNSQRKQYDLTKANYDSALKAGNNDLANKIKSKNSKRITQVMDLESYDPKNYPSLNEEVPLANQKKNTKVTNPAAAGSTNNTTNSTNTTGIMRSNLTGSNVQTTNNTRTVTKLVRTGGDVNALSGTKGSGTEFKDNTVVRQNDTKIKVQPTRIMTIDQIRKANQNLNNNYDPLVQEQEDVSIDENRMASHTAGMSDAQKDAATSSVSRSTADKMGRRSDEAAFKGRKKKTSARYSSTGGKKRKNTTGRGQPEQYRKSADDDKNEARFPYGRSNIVQGKGSFKGLKKEDFDAFDIVLGYLVETEQVDSLDEALYIMMEMDAATIQNLVKDFELLVEEAADREKDRRLELYGIGHDGSDKKAGSKRRSGGKRPKGKTPLQKETEKKYGKGKTAVEIVRKKIEDEHGKGAIA